MLLISRTTRARNDAVDVRSRLQNCAAFAQTAMSPFQYFFCYIYANTRGRCSHSAIAVKRGFANDLRSDASNLLHNEENNVRKATYICA